MTTNPSSCIPSCLHEHRPIDLDNMDTNLIGPCKVPDAILDVASRPGRLIKDKDGVWKLPSNWTAGGKVTTARMMPWGLGVGQ